MMRAHFVSDVGDKNNQITLSSYYQYDGEHGRITIFEPLVVSVSRHRVSAAPLHFIDIYPGKTVAWLHIMADVRHISQCDARLCSCNLIDAIARSSIERVYVQITKRRWLLYYVGCRLQSQCCVHHPVRLNRARRPIKDIIRLNPIFECAAAL